MKDKVGKVCVVTWEDAWSDDSNRYTQEQILHEKPFVGRSTGVVIRDNRAGISLAREYFPSSYRHIQHIPRAMVRRVQVLGKF